MPATFAPDWLAEPTDVNELATKVWPRRTTRDDSGEITIGGTTASALVAQYGTPVLVLDEQEIRDRAAETVAAFTDAAATHNAGVTVYYAGKAFLSTHIARWMTEAGLNVDVCSGGELAVALAAGIAPERLGFHGNNKSDAEIDRAVSVGVGTIIIDSFEEVDRVAAAAAQAGTRQRVLVRVNSGVHAETHDFLATAHEDQKFGITLRDAPRVVAAIRAHSSLEFRGLHCHIGSQIFGSSGFRESARRMVAAHTELLAGGEAPQLNLGGGFGIAYTSIDDPAPIADLAREIVDAVAEECVARGIAIPHLSFEPGRSIVGTAGVTLYSVGTTKEVTVDTPEGERMRRYISVDGGMSDNARTALYGAQYSARLANRTSGSAAQLSRVVGMHCESGDIVVDNEYLPADATRGDLIAVPATGAYCASLASNYNHVPRPPVIAVRGGEARILVRGETIDDLLARDAGADEGEA